MCVYVGVRERVRVSMCVCVCVYNFWFSVTHISTPFSMEWSWFADIQIRSVVQWFSVFTNIKFPVYCHIKWTKMKNPPETRYEQSIVPKSTPFYFHFLFIRSFSLVSFHFRVFRLFNFCCNLSMFGFYWWNSVRARLLFLWNMEHDRLYYTWRETHWIEMMWTSIWWQKRKSMFRYYFGTLSYSKSIVNVIVLNELQKSNI